MKDKYSNAGKGDKSRISNKKRFDKNWDKIFGSKDEKKTKKQTGQTYRTVCLLVGLGHTRDGISLNHIT